jgi:serralysin
LTLSSAPAPDPIKVWGGAGDDTINVTLNNLAYAIYGGDGNDRIEVSSMFSEGAKLYGGAGDDVLIGSAGADTLNGGTGDDHLTGGGGNDLLVGGDGIDQLSGGDGDDTYVITDAGDTIREANSGIHIANEDFDHFFAFYGIDMDVFLDRFGNVNPTQNAFVPFDTVGSDLFGASYDEVRDLFVDVFFGLVPFEFLPDNSVFVGEFATGIDTVKSSVSFDFNDATRVFGILENLVLTGSDDIDGFGNDAANRITGNSGDNTLLGRGGEDRLNGGGGDDVLSGGQGRDVLFGGAGNDTFKYFSSFDSGATATSRDIIKDFETGDTIDLSAMQNETGVALHFVGAAEFSSEAGEVRQFALGGYTVLAADIDGDGFGEFQIAVAGAVTFNDANLLLQPLI